MINYSTWKEKTVSVTKLKLDFMNPRLSHIKKGVSQNELINEMVENYKVLELAQSIAEDGFFPDKNLISIMEVSDYIIVEGNRRLAALKALLTPDIISGKLKAKFRKLNTIIDESYIQRITIIIAPSRDSANPIIFKEHTDRTAIRWSRIMQAEFYKKQLENEVSLDELSSKYNKTNSDITSFLKLINMYEIACNLNYQDENTHGKVLDKQNFNASVLERVYDSQKMKDFLKFDFDSAGNIVGKTKKDDFKKAYVKVVEDIADGKINTRTLNKAEDFDEYTNSIKGHEPQSTGKFSHKDLIKDSLSLEISVETEKPKIKRTIQQSSCVIPRGIPFTLEGATNLKYFYTELKKISVKSYPNAVAATLRAFLDKSLRMYLKKKKIKKLSINEDGKSVEKRLVDLSLGGIIDSITKKGNSLLDDNTMKILRQFKSSADKASLNALNSIMHNEEYSLNENEVRQIWTKLESVFRDILLEPNR